MEILKEKLDFFKSNTKERHNDDLNLIENWQQNRNCR